MRSAARAPALRRRRDRAALQLLGDGEALEAAAAGEDLERDLVGAPVAWQDQATRYGKRAGPAALGAGEAHPAFDARAHSAATASAMRRRSAASGSRPSPARRKSAAWSGSPVPGITHVQSAWPSRYFKKNCAQPSRRNRGPLRYRLATRRAQQAPAAEWHVGDHGHTASRGTAAAAALRPRARRSNRESGGNRPSPRRSTASTSAKAPAV